MESQGLHVAGDETGPTGQQFSRRWLCPAKPAGLAAAGAVVLLERASVGRPQAVLGVCNALASPHGDLSWDGTLQG